MDEDQPVVIVLPLNMGEPHIIGKLESGGEDQDWIAILDPIFYTTDGVTLRFFAAGWGVPPRGLFTNRDILWANDWMTHEYQGAVKAWRTAPRMKSSYYVPY